jgi:HEAT repeat protein
MNPADPPARADSVVADTAQRRRSAALAGHAGDLTTATALLADPDAGVRVAALGALARCDAIDADVCSQAVADPDPDVRRRLAEELGRQRPADPGRRLQALQVALQLLDDPDPMAAEAAAWSVGELAGPDPDNDDDNDRPNDDRPDDDRPDDDRPNDVTATAGVTDALSRTATDHPDQLVRESAVAALGAVGDVAGLAAVLTATTDKPAVRRRAVIALASFLGEPGVDEALQRATADRDWQVRQAADMLLDTSD